MIRPTLIETDRLILRPFEASDVQTYARIRAKANVIRFLPGGVENADRADEIAQQTVMRFSALWSSEPNYGPWAVIEKTSKSLRGHLGLRLLPELEGQTELLYMLDDQVWGLGYATEGSLAALEYGFDRLHLDRIIALALPDNDRSQRVMKRLGMVRNPSLVEVFGLTAVEYEISREIWKRDVTEPSDTLP